MDKEIFQNYLKNELVRKELKQDLAEFSNQNDTTKIALAETSLLRNRVYNHIINELTDENVELENEIENLKVENNFLNEKVKIYENKHGEINSDYLLKFDSIKLSENEKAKRKYDKLLKLAQKMSKCQQSMLE